MISLFVPLPLLSLPVVTLYLYLYLLYLSDLYKSTHTLPTILPSASSQSPSATMLSSGAAASVNLNYHDLDNILSQPETEHNWAQKETAIKTIGAACHVSIGHNQEYVAFIKNHRKAFSESVSPIYFSFQINNSNNEQRTRNNEQRTTSSEQRKQ